MNSTQSTTQTEHPWRATARTVFAFIVAVAAIWSLVVEAAGFDDALPVVAATVALAGGITRVMALPGVNDLLTRFFPWLAAAPPQILPDRDAPDFYREDQTDIEA